MSKRTIYAIEAITLVGLATAAIALTHKRHKESSKFREGRAGDDSTQTSGSSSSTSCSHRYAQIFSTKGKLSSKSEKRAYYDACHANDTDPALLSNFLRPWQTDFLSTLDIQTAEELIEAHRRSDVSISNAMCAYCVRNDLAKVDTHSCFVALNGWCMVARGVVRHIKGRERMVRFADIDGDTVVEISILSEGREFDNVSTLGFESVAG